MISFTLSERAKRIAEIVGNGGAHRDVIPHGLNAKNRTKEHRQKLGVLGEIAMAGEEEGIRLFTQDMQRMEQVVGGDGGRDVFHRCDVKTRQIE